MEAASGRLDRLRRWLGAQWAGAPGSANTAQSRQARYAAQKQSLGTLTAARFDRAAVLSVREDLRQLASLAEHANRRGAVDVRRRARQVVFYQREGALRIVEDVLGAHVQHAR